MKNSLRGNAARPRQRGVAILLTLIGGNGMMGGMGGGMFGGGMGGGGGYY